MRQFLTGNGLFACFDTPWVPLHLGVLFLFHPWLGIFATCAGIILLVLTIANEKTTKTLLAEASSEQIQAQNLANSNLRNAEVLHAMGMLPGIIGRWSKRHHELLSKQSQASGRAGALTNTSKVLRLLFQSMILSLGAFLVLQGDMVDVLDARASLYDQRINYVDTLGNYALDRLALQSAVGGLESEDLADTMQLLASMTANVSTPAAE